MPGRVSKGRGEESEMVVRLGWVSASQIFSGLTWGLWVGMVLEGAFWARLRARRE